MSTFSFLLVLGVLVVMLVVFLVVLHSDRLRADERAELDRAWRRAQQELVRQRETRR